MKQVAIIGAGPAGLMVAEQLSANPRFKITLFDAMPSAGRKFLQAGRGGLNITHSKPLNEFIAAYGDQAPQVKSWLQIFGPDQVRDWVHGFGIETFAGSSGRVYPADMKAAPLLRKWLVRLRQQGVEMRFRHRWLGWTAPLSMHRPYGLRMLTSAGEVQYDADVVILALGGASWPHLGSDGRWADQFQSQDLAPFQPANCGFNQAWSPVFRERFAGQPLKNVVLSLVDAQQQTWTKQGECLVTDTGLEGSLIYAQSRMIRDTLLAQGQVKAYLDLLPAMSAEQLSARLAKTSNKLSLSNRCKRAGIDALRLGLLREALAPKDLTAASDALDRLVSLLKHYPLHLTSPRPIAEAISTAGGVKFEVLDEQGQLRHRPGCYCVGEMLNWEAPTGGYLLTAVLAQAVCVAQQLNHAEP